MRTGESEGRKQFQIDRLIYFSDAVFAIAITLLALNIQTPPLDVVTEYDLRRALALTLPKIIGFVLSFLVIGTYWRAHHRLFGWVRGYDARLIGLNMRLLLCVTFVPFPTAFYSQYPDAHTPLVFYAFSLAIVGLAHAALRRYVFATPSLHDPATPPQTIRLMQQRAYLIPCVCAVAAAASFVSLWLGRLGLIGIPVVLLIYTRYAARAPAKAEASDVPLA